MSRYYAKGYLGLDRSLKIHIKQCHNNGVRAESATNLPIQYSERKVKGMSFITNMNAYDIVYPNPVPEGVVLEKNLYATMRDGIKIAVDVYKPEDAVDPLPVILAYSSFPKERIFESAKPGFYCRNGYICAQASERGVGLNGGQFDFQGAKSAEDGYDIIEWIAAQPWCDGNVAMMGASGYGVMSWLTASTNPPHLKTIVVLGTTDNYRGLCYPGGVLRKPFVQYLVTQFAIGALWPGHVPGKEPPANVMKDILSNYEDGPFWWGHGSTWKKIEQIKVPVMNLVHVPNRLHTTSHLRSYKDLKSPKKLMITPWTKENYQPWIFETVSFNQQILKWLDYWMKGVDTGIMGEPEIAVYDSGTGKWRYENEYPLARTKWTKYYLADGNIGTAPPANVEKPDIYRNLSVDADMIMSYGATAGTKLGQKIEKPGYIIYTTPPLEEDLTIYGPVSVTLYAATAEEVTSDLSFFVKMGEMAAEGVPLNPVTGEPEVKPEITDRFTPPEVQIWTWGSLKAKYREVDEEMSAPGSPWHSFDKPEEIKPNTVYEFQIELIPLFRTFRKGNKIWLKVSSSDNLYSTRDVTSRFIETPILQSQSEISIYHTPEYPTHVLLPIIQDAPEVAPVKPPLIDAVPGAPRII